jgi:alpha-tubulin suppressor-like RCC1 family protein
MLDFLQTHEGAVVAAQFLTWGALLAAGLPSLSRALRDLGRPTAVAVVAVGAAAAALSLTAFSPFERFEAIGHSASYADCFHGVRSPDGAIEHWSTYTTYPLMRWLYWGLGVVFGREDLGVLLVFNAASRGVGVMLLGALAGLWTGRGSAAVLAAVLLAVHPVHAFWGAGIFNLSIPLTAALLCCTQAVAAWRTGSGVLLAAAAASGCLAVAGRVEWGLLAPALGLLLLGLDGPWGRHAAVRTRRFWAPTAVVLGTVGVSVLPRGSALTNQGGYHDVSDYLGVVLRQAGQLEWLGPVGTPQAVVAMLLGAGLALHRGQVRRRVLAGGFAFLAVTHFGLASFLDLGFRHALLPALGAILLLSLAAPAWMDRPSATSPREWIPALFVAATIAAAVPDLADWTHRYYMSEEDFEAIPSFGGASIDAAAVEASGCFLVTDNERLGDLGLAGSYYRLLEPPDAHALWEEHSGCVLWLYGFYDHRADGRVGYGRGVKLRRTFDWIDEGWTRLEDHAAVVVYSMASPPWPGRYDGVLTAPRSWRNGPMPGGPAAHRTGGEGARPPDDPPPESTTVMSGRELVGTGATVGLVQVAAGGRHTCALDAAGIPRCWGDERYGQTSPAPGPFADLASGRDFTCGLTEAGAVRCWGFDGQGQAAPPGSDGFSRLAAGGQHACALDSAGSVHCWGAEDAGQASPPTGAFASLALGGRHSCALDEAGAATCWGRSTEGQLRVPEGSFTTLAAGDGHTCGLRRDGSVICWGQDDFGQARAPAGPFVAVDAGALHTCGLLEGGRVVCWGDERAGRSTPPTIQASAVSLGAAHGCAIDLDGGLWCWGADRAGQAAPPGGGFASVSVGGTHSCGVGEDGSVRCSGDNEQGQVSPPTGRFGSVAVGPGYTCALGLDRAIACWGWNGEGQARPPDGGYRALAVGESHACALESSGTMRCWGANDEGQASPQSGTWAEIGAGAVHTCALDEAGRASCWGDTCDWEHRPPTGPLTGLVCADRRCCALGEERAHCWGDMGSAAEAPARSDLVKIALGREHGCALTADGTVLCWGDDEFGQAVAPDGRFLDISVGDDLSCGVTEVGGVVCWGVSRGPEE